jgi:hypothetical protein
MGAVPQWGADYVRVLCTTPKCGHEWDVHRTKTGLMHPQMDCTWCGGVAKPVARDLDTPAV